MLAWLALISFAALPKISVVVDEERSTWQPIDPQDVERAMGQAALEAFTQEASASLEAVPLHQLAKADGDYLLRVLGRMLDETESHVVQISLESLRKNDLPSVRAADTIVIGKLERSKMIERIEASARSVGKKVGALSKAALQHTSSAALPTPVSPDTPLPWTWAEFKEPKQDSTQASVDVMLNDNSKAHAALRELASLAFVDNNVRKPLGHCALQHKAAEMRRECLLALRPIVDRSAEAQRMVIEVFLRDGNSRTREAASEIMTYFSGVARNDAIAAWLQRAAQGDVYGPLRELGELPNLDVVAAKCLVACGKREKYQRGKSQCLGLLEPLSTPRRYAVLQRALSELDPDSPLYLEGAGTGEGSHGTDWQTAWQLVIEGAPQFWPGFEQVLWKRYERTLSQSALSALADYAPPTEQLVARMAEVIVTAGQREGVFGLRRIAKQEPKLRPAIKEKIAEMLATNAFHKDVSARTLEDTVKEIERLEKKEARQ